MSDPRLTKLAASLPEAVPFVGPETQERARGAPFGARLGANESLFGPAPEVLKAIAAAGSEAWMYGDPEMFDLRVALARHLGIPAASVLPGEGIDGMLGYVVRLFVGPGDAVVTSEGAYPTFNYHVTGHGGQLHKVPYQEDHEDPQALIEAAKRTGAKLIYLSNPDNPMGSWHSAETIAQMTRAVPEGALLVLDEAYIETAPEGTAPAIDPQDHRVIRMRTFSKAYGLAGLRVGYAISHPRVIAALHRIRNHFGLGRLVQSAAIAALGAQDHLSAVIRQTEAARAELADIARENGLVALPSATNFVTIDCGRDGDFARAVLAELLARGIFVRMPFVAPQDRCIRLSCGGAREMSLLRKHLPAALSQARAQAS